MPRTNKHLTKKEKFFAGVEPDPNFHLVNVSNSELEEGEPMMRVKDAAVLVNAMIQQGSTYVEYGIKTVQRLHDLTGSNKKLVVCACCAKKIGIKRCAQCPSTSTVRYCSRRCQVADWPAHKACCCPQRFIEVE